MGTHKISAKYGRFSINRGTASDLLDSFYTPSKEVSIALSCGCSQPWIGSYRQENEKNTHKSSAHWGASTRSCAPPSSAKGTKVVLKSRSTGDLMHWPTLLRDTARSRLCYAGARSLQAWGLRGGGKPSILRGASTRSCAPPNSAKNTKVVLKSHLTGDSTRWPTILPGPTRSGSCHAGVRSL